MGISDVHARVLLSHLAPHPRLSATVHRRGAAEVVRDLERGIGDARDVARARQRWQGLHPARILDRLDRMGGTFLVPGDLGWPSTLSDLPVDQRPFGLWVRGTVEVRLSLLRSVAIVGSRTSTPYGDRVALGMAGDLASRGWAIVSGGAIGIDASAHRGALAVQGVTVAVLACGVDVPYPRAHDALFAAIAESGALISEVPPGEPPARFRFLERNRLIATLSRGSVVVEASLRSGALSTAAHARALERPVMGVPGPVTNVTSAGVHAAIREGAHLVTCADDVLDLVGPMDARPAPAGLGDPRDDLDDAARAVLDALPARASASLDMLAARTGLPALRLSAILGRLESSDLVARNSSGWGLTAQGRAGTRR